MTPAEHLYKARAFDRALAKLDPVQDGELYTVFLMRAGTNRLNAALHALGMTCADGPTATQLGDLNHSYKPKLPVPVPQALQAAFGDLAYIEDLRPDYSRGPRVVDAAVAERANAAYRRIVADTDIVLKAHTS